jgi:diaminohydroxyphosphoribosylaminopyrimidine deaminase/5-amino-6-(5-phosphoribosylamino)uracil reductase
MATAEEFDAMARALALAEDPVNQRGPNPRVGCVLIDTAGRVVGEGSHRGAGSPHAEVAALETAGESARGATAVVTLEPCRHTGRTGPCVEALIEAGVRRVVFAQTDPNPEAAHGAVELADAGVEVEGGVLAEQAAAINVEWAQAVTWQRPFVTLKVAATLDGRVAAADGSSQWITGPESRNYVHRIRAEADAVLVGTGTVLADDPELTDRRPEANHQPRPVVLGHREIPAETRLAQNPRTLRLRTRSIHEALSELFGHGVRHVLVEGGPTTATAFISSGYVDRLVWFVAPKLLGGGQTAVADLGIGTIDAALGWKTLDVSRLGDDVCLVLQPLPHSVESVQSTERSQ